MPVYSIAFIIYLDTGYACIVGSATALDFPLMNINIPNEVQRQYMSEPWRQFKGGGLGFSFLFLSL